MEKQKELQLVDSDLAIDFLYDYYKRSDNIVVIKHLWNNKFRVNIYHEYNSQISLFTGTKIVFSYFVEVIENKNGDFDFIDLTNKKPL